MRHGQHEYIRITNGLARTPGALMISPPSQITQQNTNTHTVAATGGQTQQLENIHRVPRPGQAAILNFV